MTAELNDGSFNAQPLAGRLKKVTGPAASLTLGGLTFGAVQPNELEVCRLPGDLPGSPTTLDAA